MLVSFFFLVSGLTVYVYASTNIDCYNKTQSSIILSEWKYSQKQYYSNSSRIDALLLVNLQPYECSKGHYGPHCKACSCIEPFVCVDGKTGSGSCICPPHMYYSSSDSSCHHLPDYATGCNDDHECQCSINFTWDPIGRKCILSPYLLLAQPQYTIAETCYPTEDMSAWSECVCVPPFVWWFDEQRCIREPTNVVSESCIMDRTTGLFITCNCLYGGNAAWDEESQSCRFAPLRTLGNCEWDATTSSWTNCVCKHDGYESCLHHDNEHLSYTCAIDWVWSPKVQDCLLHPLRAVDGTCSLNDNDGEWHDCTCRKGVQTTPRGTCLSCLPGRIGRRCEDCTLEFASAVQLFRQAFSIN